MLAAWVVHGAEWPGLVQARREGGVSFGDGSSPKLAGRAPSVHRPAFPGAGSGLLPAEPMFHWSGPFTRGRAAWSFYSYKWCDGCGFGSCDILIYFLILGNAFLQLIPSLCSTWYISLHALPTAESPLPLSFFTYQEFLKPHFTYYSCHSFQEVGHIPWETTKVQAMPGVLRCCSIWTF